MNLKDSALWPLRLCAIFDASERFFYNQGPDDHFYWLSRATTLLLSAGAETTTSFPLSSCCDEKMLCIFLFVGFQPFKDDVDDLFDDIDDILADYYDLNNASVQSRLKKLRLLACFHPESIEWMDGWNLKDLALQQDEMLKTKEEIATLKTEWTKTLLFYCSNRIIDISMIFHHLPSLIIVQFCLFDRDCLGGIEERFIWDLVNNVRKIKIGN